MMGETIVQAGERGKQEEGIARSRDSLFLFTCFSANLAPAHVFVLDHFATRVQSPPMGVVEIG
jgi:hypothetical protein